MGGFKLGFDDAAELRDRHALDLFGVEGDVGQVGLALVFDLGRLRRGETLVDELVDQLQALRHGDLLGDLDFLTGGEVDALQLAGEGGFDLHGKEDTSGNPVPELASGEHPAVTGDGAFSLDEGEGHLDVSYRGR